MKERHPIHIAHFNILMEMIRKHFRVIFQNPVSIFTMLAGPLLVIFLIGLAFNTSGTHGIVIGHYSESYNELSHEIVGVLKQNFTVIKKNSTETCKEGIATGELNLCLVFPADLNPKTSNNIDAYADFSQLNLVYIILDKLNTHLGIQVKSLSESYVQDILNTVTLASQEIQNRKNDLSTAQTTTNNMQTDLLDVKQTLIDSPTVFQPPAVTDLGLAIDDISADVNSLSLVVNSIVSLEDLIAEDLTVIRDDLEDAEAQWETECNNGTTAADCDEQQAYIDELDAQESMISSYESYIDGGAIDSYIINVQVGMTELKPYAAEMSQKLQEAQFNLQKTHNNIQNATTKLDATQSDVRKTTSTLTNLVSSHQLIQNSISNIEITNATNVANPITTSIKEVSRKGKHIDSLFPEILTLLIMFVGTLLAAIFIIIEKKSAAFIRNHIAPIHRIFFPVSAWFVLLCIMLAETLVVLFIAELVFAVPIHTQTFALLLTILLSGTVFILIGMSIGFFFNNEETIALASIFAASVMMLFSSFVFPIQNMHPALAKLASVNPFYIASQAFRKITIFQAEGYIYAAELGLLLISIFLLIGVFAIAYQYSLKKY